MVKSDYWSDLDNGESDGQGTALGGHWGMARGKRREPALYKAGEQHARRWNSMHMRPGGRVELCVFKEQAGGQCGQSTVACRGCRRRKRNDPGPSHTGPGSRGGGVWDFAQGDLERRNDVCFQKLSLAPGWRKGHPETSVEVRAPRSCSARIKRQGLGKERKCIDSGWTLEIGTDKTLMEG